jgi:hypothetical protein
MKQVFTKILDNAQVVVRNVEEQIQIIVHTLEGYRKEIEELN